TLTGGKWIPGTDVRLLWRAGIPWPESAAASQPSTAPVPIEAIPETRQEIEEWLIRESRRLQPHVARQLTENLHPLIDFVESLPRESRSEVFADLRLRIDNESKLVWNNIKANQIL